MPILDSTFPDRKVNTLQKKHVSGFLSLNDALKESLRKAQAEVDTVKMIVRCEPLPQVQADHDEIVRFFDGLLGMILCQPSGVSRLFLYVDYEEDNTELIDVALQEGCKRYNIRLRTNISTGDDWRQVNSQALFECRQILSRHNGTLVVNDISSAGCLFSVSLPGKIE